MKTCFSLRLEAFILLEAWNLELKLNLYLSSWKMKICCNVQMEHVHILVLMETNSYISNIALCLLFLCYPVLFFSFNYNVSLLNEKLVNILDQIMF